MKILVSLFAFSLGFLTAQSSDPVIGWLTRLQAVQATLRMLPDTAAADLNAPTRTSAYCAAKSSLTRKRKR